MDRQTGGFAMTNAALRIVNIMTRCKIYEELENVAINDVLPLKAARHYAIADAKWFWGPRDANDPISMVSFTFVMRRHLTRLASAPFTSFRLTHFGWVPFADLRVQRRATKQNTEFTEGAWKLRSYFSQFVNQSSRNSEMMWKTPPTSHCLCPIVCVTFSLEDIRH